MFILFYLISGVSGISGVSRVVSGISEVTSGVIGIVNEVVLNSINRAISYIWVKSILQRNKVLSFVSLIIFLNNCNSDIRVRFVSENKSELWELYW